jgi:hypothetical protein
MRERAEVEIVGILRERHADHIILCNGTLLFLKEGVSLDDCPIGRSLTAKCTIADGKKVAEEIRLNPDWLLDAVEALPLATWDDGDPPPSSVVPTQGTVPNPVRDLAPTPRLVDEVVPGVSAVAR